MSWQVVELNDVPSSPWKNGGGTTRELITWPMPDDWKWRMSVAEVTQSGPFSSFEGIQRWFAVLEGDGVALFTQGERHVLTADSVPFRFDGGLATGCELLGGPTRDFNLMTRAGAASVTMTRVQGRFEQTIDASEIVAVYSISAGALAQFSSESAQFAAHSLAWRVADRTALLALEAVHALVIRIVVTDLGLGDGMSTVKETS